METNQQADANKTARPFAVETLSCPNCHAGLLRGMRFCRTCGYRLGEGIAEYVETMRFDGTLPVAVTPTPQTMAQAPAPPTTTLAPSAMPRRARSFCGGRSNWLMWPLMFILLTSAFGGTWLRSRPFLRDRFRQNVRTILGINTPSSNVLGPRSFFGTRGFVGVEDGVMLDVVIPNGPAERAGLVGGDIITAFDGKHPKDEADMARLLRATPIGKAVELAFLRDGEPKVTTLTTASPADFNPDSRSLMNPGGGPEGFLGVDNFERVPVPGTNLHGVELGEVITNRPADLAGLQEGDIVVEFNGTPIRTTAEFEARIHRAAPGQTVNVAVMRAGQRMVIPVKMGRR
ncbi:MAG TPA: PDZ domain-containing protein [Pyrinomonadaceae bacterium]